MGGERRERKISRQANPLGGADASSHGPHRRSSRLPRRGRDPPPGAGSVALGQGAWALSRRGLAPPAPPTPTRRPRHFRATPILEVPETHFLSGAPGPKPIDNPIANHNGSEESR